MDNSTLIDKYIKGELPPAEQQALEQRMDRDKGFAQEVKTQLFEEKVLEKLAEENIRADFLQLQEEYEKQQLPSANPKIGYLKRHRWAVAAGIAFILASSSYFYVQRSILPQYANRSIALSELRKNPLSLTRNAATAPIGMGQSIENVTSPSPSKVQAGINWLLSVPDTADMYQDAQFYLGYGYLKIGEYTQAVDRFIYLQAPSVKTSIGKDDIDYYLLLSYLADDREAEALNLLFEITTNPNHDYYGTDAIKDLEKRLHSVWRRFI